MTNGQYQNASHRVYSSRLLTFIIQAQSKGEESVLTRTVLTGLSLGPDRKGLREGLIEREK